MDGLDVGLPHGSADWLAFKRQHVERLWRHAAAERLRELAGEPSAAVVVAEALLTIDPFEETALLALGEACAALGQHARALRALQAHSERLAKEYGIDPPAPLRALAGRLRAPASPHRSAGSGPSPAASGYVAGLVGRRLELAQLTGLLAEASCRVVTILGPGGIGKSSVARASLPALGARYVVRAEWVPLEDLRSIAEVPGRVAAVMALQLRGDEDAWTQIQVHVAGGPRLVVFDNVEHLDGFGTAIESLIAAAPELKVIVTSRSRLAIAGEWLLPLEGLPLPDSDETDVGDAVGIDANGASVTDPKDVSTYAHMFGCWETLYVIKQAIEASGYKSPADKAKLIEATEAIATIDEGNEHPQGDKMFNGKMHQGFGHQNISKVEGGKLKVVHRTSIDEGLYEPTSGLHEDAALAVGREDCGQASPVALPDRARPLGLRTAPFSGRARGPVTAAVLALTALGLSLVFGVMRVVNVAHGELFMLGAVLAWASASPSPVIRRSGFWPRWC